MQQHQISDAYVAPLVGSGNPLTPSNLTPRATCRRSQTLGHAHAVRVRIAGMVRVPSLVLVLDLERSSSLAVVVALWVRVIARVWRGAMMQMSTCGRRCQRTYQS